MSFNYSGDPANSDRDAVRFMIGDTDQDFPELSDEEVAHVLSTTSSTAAAAVTCCRRISAKYASEVDRKVGDLQVSASQKMAQWSDLANQIEADTAATGVFPHPTAGGILVADNDAAEDDTSLIEHAFKVGQFDYTETAAQQEAEA